MTRENMNNESVFQPSPDQPERSFFSLKEAFSQAWGVFSSRFTDFLIVTLVIYLPINAALTFVPAGDDLEGFSQFMRVANLLEFFVGIIATIAVVSIAKAALDNAPISWREGFARAFHLYFPALGTQAIMSLMLLGLFILLIIPGIIFAVYWGFALLVVVFREQKYMDALRYSKSLVRGRWWNVFGVILLITVLAFITMAVVVSPAWVLPEHYALDIMFDTFIDIIAAYFTIVMMLYFFYLDKTRLVEVEHVVSESKEEVSNS